MIRKKILLMALCFMTTGSLYAQNKDETCMISLIEKYGVINTELLTVANGLENSARKTSKVQSYIDIGVIKKIPKGSKLCLVTHGFNSYRAKVRFEDNNYWINVFGSFPNDTSRYVKFN